MVSGWSGPTCDGVILNRILSAVHFFQSSGVYVVLAGNVGKIDRSKLL